MEYKYKLIPLLRYSSLVVLLFLAISTQAGHSTYNNLGNSNNNLDSSIYYGDSEVYVGQPFAITCIVSITEPIQWSKDEELIKKRNIRHHGKDEHFYVETQNEVEGEPEKIASTISVQHALPKHEGIYRCNEFHSNFHTLRVKKSNLHNRKDHFFKIVEHSEPFQLEKKVDEEFLTNEYLYDLAKIAAESAATTATEQLVDNQHHHKVSHAGDSSGEEEEAVSAKNQEGASGENFEITEDVVPNYSETPTHDNTSLVFELENEDPEGLEKQTEEDVSKTLEGGMYIVTQILPITTTPVAPTIATTEPPVVKYTNNLKHDAKSAKIEKSSTKKGTSTVETNIPRNVVTTAPPVTTAIVVYKPKIVDKTSSKLINLNTDALQPNYDIPADNIKIFDIRSSLHLSCKDEKNLGELTWYKGDTEVSKVEALKDRYKIIKAENAFDIDRTNEDDDGTYYCKAGSESAEINVVANVFVKLPSSSVVVEGEKLTIQCTVVGTDPKIQWSVGSGNSTTLYEETEDRIKLEADSNNVKNAILIIEEARMEDRNTYTCIASNKASKHKNQNVSSETYVRVKGKLAALWPFLGICAEVFVLCAIILIYEKRRNRAEPEESDTDQSPDQKNEQQGKDSDVRHRK